MQGTVDFLAQQVLFKPFSIHELTRLWRLALRVFLFCKVGPSVGPPNMVVFLWGVFLRTPPPPSPASIVIGRTHLGLRTQGNDPAPSNRFPFSIPCRAR